ncbi:MAG TPA: hypothetical protein VI136_26780 [Verrucomicrobiae bacterium]
MTTRRRLAVVLVFVFTLNSLPAVDAVWRADSGVLPDQVWPNWNPNIVNGVSTPVYLTFTNDCLLVDTSGGGDHNKAAYWLQDHATLTIPTNYVIEARVRYVSGGRLSPARTHCCISWETTNYVGNALNIIDGEIFIWLSNSAKGPSVAVDTASAPHTYRIEFNGTAANSPFNIYQDGVPVLSGTNAYNPSFFTAYPRLWFGDGSSQAYGVAEWYSFRHNALTPATAGLGKGLYCAASKYVGVINPTNAQAAFVCVNTNVPGDPNNLVYGLAADLNSQWLYSILSPGGSLPQLFRLNPVTGDQAIMGTLQTTNNLIKSTKALAFNPVTGVLYASVRTNLTGSHAPVVVTVNPQTAQATIVNTITGTARDDLDALGFIGNTLYALDIDPMVTFLTYLYTINLETGQATLVGSTGIGALYGLAYNSDDGFFYSSETAARKLYRVSPATGAATLVGTTHTASELGGHVIYALAFATPPGPPPAIQPVANGMEIAWPSVAGAYYWVQTAPALAPGTVWTNLAGPFTGSGAVDRCADPGAGEPSRFYRIRVGW